VQTNDAPAFGKIPHCTYIKVVPCTHLFLNVYLCQITSVTKDKERCGFCSCTKRTLHSLKREMLFSNPMNTVIAQNYQARTNIKSLLFFFECDFPDETVVFVVKPLRKYLRVIFSDIISGRTSI